MNKGHMLAHEIQQTGAVFGRNSEVSVVFEADGHHNTTAYTDGKEIVLPSLPDELEFTHEETMTMRGLLDHEAGHVRHTDFTVVEKFAKTQSKLAFNISNCLEDVRLEGLVMQEYPGSRKNFTVMRESVGKHELEFTQANPEVFTTITPEAIMSSIIRAGTLDYAGGPNKAMYDQMPERFKAWGHKFADEARACKDTSEILNLALAIEKLIEQSEQDKKPEPMPDEGGKADAGKGLDGNPENFTFDKGGDFTEGKPEKEVEQADGQPTLADILADVSKGVKKELKDKIDAFLNDPGKPRGKDYRVLTTRYDEVYTRNSNNNRKDRRHKKLKNASANEYETVKLQLGGLVNTMKAKLRRALMAKESRDWDFGREFGKLDTKRLVAGSLGSQTVYKQRKDRLELDTAVHFLIDLSGSMGSSSKIRVARDAAVAFAECLEGTQIRYQISGFDNEFHHEEQDSKFMDTISKARCSKSKYHRYEPLNIIKFKDFSEPLQLAKGPISTINECASGNNSDRDAVIWAYHELLKRPEKRKILFVLSDGLPENYMINLYGSSHLVVGLKLAIEECTKSGVECVGIGICSSSVVGIYPKAVTINNVNDLSGVIFTQLSNLLTGGKVHF
jgi:cobalamin biosynthesis protein CobT